MKINLLPLKKEQEKQRKKISISLISVSFIILAVLGGIFFIVFGTNLYLKSRINSLCNKIKEKNDGIGQYSKIETKVNNVVTGLDNIKQILDSRINWEDLLAEIETFMPKESFLTSLAITREDITFNVKTRSIGKVAEFIESLRNYEISITDSSNNQDQSVTATNDVSNTATSSDEDDPNKVKLFNNIDISDYAKENKSIDVGEGKMEQVTYYSLEIKAKISEVLWSKNQK